MPSTMILTKGTTVTEEKAKKQRQYHEKKKSEGLARAVIYVPAEQTDEIKAIAANMRARAKNPNIQTALKNALEICVRELQNPVNDQSCRHAISAGLKALAETTEASDPLMDDGGPR